MSQHNSKQTILVIDDEDIVRQSFCDTLEDLGYEVLAADNGKLGLELALSHQPDLVLTDLRMPIMGGLEFLAFCSKKLKDLPVIVISGAGLMGDVVEALRLGAFDYLTKPIRDPDFLLAAVSRALEQVRLKKENQSYQLDLEKKVEQRTHELHATNQQLAEHQNHLEELVASRTNELQVLLSNLKSTQAQLIESAKMASLGRLVAGVSHELNTPLGICLTYISSLDQKINSFEKAFHKGELRKDDFEKFLTSTQEASSLVMGHLAQASELVQNFKMVSVDVSSDMQREFDLVSYVKNVIQSLKSEIFDTDIELVSAPDQSYVINCYPGLFTQIFSNLILNSITHGFDAPNYGNIHISFKYENDELVIIYKDDGKGMNDEVKNLTFEPFFTTTRGMGGSGLGMNILYNLVVNNLSGSVICHSELGQGVEFIIKLPAAQLQA